MSPSPQDELGGEPFPAELEARRQVPEFTQAPGSLPTDQSPRTLAAAPYLIERQAIEVRRARWGRTADGRAAPEVEHVYARPTPSTERKDGRFKALRTFGGWLRSLVADD